jgi:hypothetical protein
VQIDPFRRQEALQAQVGHHRGDDTLAAQTPVGRPGLCDQGQDLVAIDQLARLVRYQQPIGVAIQRDAKLCPMLPDLGA